VSALLIISVEITEVAAGFDSVVVSASTFNASVDEFAEGLDDVLANAVLFVTITEGAVATDQIIARLLWELINDAQTANWAYIDAAQTPGWTVISNGQAGTWQAIKTQD
jgi:hypothetical protein